MKLFFLILPFCLILLFCYEASHAQISCLKLFPQKRSNIISNIHFIATRIGLPLDFLLFLINQQDTPIDPTSLKTMNISLLGRNFPSIFHPFYIHINHTTNNMDTKNNLPILTTPFRDGGIFILPKNIKNYGIPNLQPKRHPIIKITIKEEEISFVRLIESSLKESYANLIPILSEELYSFLKKHSLDQSWDLKSVHIDMFWPFPELYAQTQNKRYIMPAYLKSKNRWYWQSDVPYDKPMFLINTKKSEILLPTFSKTDLNQLIFSLRNYFNIKFILRIFTPNDYFYQLSFQRGIPSKNLDLDLDLHLDFNNSSNHNEQINLSLSP